MLDAIHDLEAWNEADLLGGLGRVSLRGSASGCAARSTSSTGPPSSDRSRSMLELLHELAEGPDAPGTITFIGGDVHTAYIAEVELGERQQSRVFQVVCSPFRNPLRAARAANDPPAAEPCRPRRLPPARDAARAWRGPTRAGGS